MTDMPINSKEGRTPCAILPDYKSPPRDVQRLPGGTPGWRTMPRPTNEERKNER